jgi:hypothetical protein
VFESEPNNINNNKISIYEDKPKDEKKLFILQDIFLQDKTNNSLEKLILSCRIYALKIITKFCKKYNLYYITELETIWSDIAYYLTIKYKDKSFVVRASFGEAIKGILMNVLWNKSKIFRENNIISLSIDDSIELYEMFKIYNDNNIYPNMYSEIRHTADYYIQNIVLIIKEYLSFIKQYSSFNYLKILIGLTYKLSQEKNKDYILYDEYKNVFLTEYHITQIDFIMDKIKEYLLSEQN